MGTGEIPVKNGYGVEIERFLPQFQHPYFYRRMLQETTYLIIKSVTKRV
jgi:hypothetical protein